MVEHCWPQHTGPYLDHLTSARRSPRTIWLRIYQLDRFAREHPGLEPADITAEQIEKYLGNPHWAPNTAAVAKSSLVGFFRYLHRRGILTVDPTADLLPLRVPHGKPKPASDSAYAEALDHASPRVQLMVFLGALAGLRAMEIAAVHADDVTETPGGVTLRIFGKGSKTRIVPISDELALQILELGPGYIFPGKDHGHLSPAYVSRLVSNVLPPGVTCHKLRHRFATRAYRGSGSNLRAVQELLGHASIATTQGYVGIEASELRQAALSAG